MSSSCTLVGCGMRNITSCFFARRIRFEEKSDALSRRSPETSNGSIVFDFTSGGGEGRLLNMAANKSEETRQKSVQSSSPSRSKRINGSEAEPHVAEGDYLVFCFRDDGAIDIIDGAGDEEEDENVDEKGSKNYEIKEMMEDFEGCDSNSNLSDTSSGSFAFPILKLEEWIGSPVHMPKHENQSVRLHCCRF